MTKSLTSLYLRDLESVSNEINLYADVSQLWMLRSGIKNSAGNLTLHICGNLQHYIGSILGNTGYQRNREFEFSASGLSVESLNRELKNTEKVVREILPKLKDEILLSKFPADVLGYEMNVEYFLIHLYGHLNYHLGQINYHRRLC